MGTAIEAWNRRAEAQEGEAVAVADGGILNWYDGAQFYRRADLYLHPAQSPAQDKDGERLDWLQTIVDHFANIDRITSVAGKFNGLKSLRDAIDAAIAAQKAAEQLEKEKQSEN